jgi:hypothetical protein
VIGSTNLLFCLNLKSERMTAIQQARIERARIMSAILCQESKDYMPPAAFRRPDGTFLLVRR